MFNDGSERRRAMGGTRVLVARGVDADAISSCGASAEQHQLQADGSLGKVEVTLGRLHPLVGVLFEVTYNVKIIPIVCK